MENIAKLCEWYKRRSINDWHEDFGIKIYTLDNPGWSLKVDIVKTGLEEKMFSEIKIDRSESDWIYIRKNDKLFEAFGGPENLDEMIGIFLGWSD